MKKFYRSHLILAAWCGDGTEDFISNVSVTLLKKSNQKGFKFSKHDISAIIHADEECPKFWSKSPLYYANERKNFENILELLKLEKTAHDSKEEGLICIKESTNKDEFQNWLRQICK